MFFSPAPAYGMNPPVCKLARRERSRRGAAYGVIRVIRLVRGGAFALLAASLGLGCRNGHPGASSNGFSSGGDRAAGEGPSPPPANVAWPMAAGARLDALVRANLDAELALRPTEATWL